MKGYNDRLRRKAWIGAAISAATNLLGGAIGASSQKKAAEEQAAAQARAEMWNRGVQSATNLTNAFQNYNELNKEFRSRFYKCGGMARKKAKWGAADTSALISGLGGLGNNIISSMIKPSIQKGFSPLAVDTKPLEVNNEATYDSISNRNMLDSYYRDRMFRCGGRLPR